jgi:hypothetical protein
MMAKIRKDALFNIKPPPWEPFRIRDKMEKIILVRSGE